MSALIKKYGQIIPESCDLICSDFSQGMLDQVAKTKTREVSQGHAVWPRVQSLVSDAMDMKDVSSASQSHILAGWVYFMTAEPQKCLLESKRMLLENGVLGATSWEDSQWLEVMRQITVTSPKRIMPSLLPEWQSATGVKKEFEKAGFVDVRSENVQVFFGYESHESLIQILLAMPHVIAMMRDASEQETADIKKAMLAKAKEFNAAEPGHLIGEAIVTVGSKRDG